ncbi:hypothetical protein Salat_2889300, partial [Sesamum alatum]
EMSMQSPNIGDTIVEGFSPSTRRTLKYIPLVIQQGKVVVQPTLSMSEQGASKWATMVVGYFLSKRSYLHQLNAFVKSTWPVFEGRDYYIDAFFVFFRFKINCSCGRSH